MATPVRMPALAQTSDELRLTAWLKAEGDQVAEGEPLFEAETDKGVSEIEAALAGVIVRLLVPDGAHVTAGDTIALIRRPGEPEGEVA